MLVTRELTLRVKWMEFRWSRELTRLLNFKQQNKNFTGCFPFESHVNYLIAHEEILPRLLDTITVLDFMLENTISKNLIDKSKTQ